MSDIVEMLREFATDYTTTTYHDELIREAADEIERLREGERAADAEIERNLSQIEQLDARCGRLRDACATWERVCADYTGVLAAQDRRIIELLEELTRIRDQIVKHNLSIREAIRRGEAFEWKTITLDS